MSDFTKHSPGLLSQSSSSSDESPTRSTGGKTVLQRPRSKWPLGNFLLLLVLIHVVAAILAIFSNSSVNGILLSGFYFPMMYSCAPLRNLFAKWTVYIYGTLTLLFLGIQAPLTLNALLSLSPLDLLNHPELLVYSFKQLSIMGYDSNYIGLICVVFSFSRYKSIFLPLSLLTGARAVIASALLYVGIRKYLRPNKLWVWVFLLVLSTYLYTGFNYENDSRSLYLKQLTVISLVNNVSEGNYKVLLFGDGQESVEDHSTVSGHTMLGTINKSGLFYVLFSLICLRVLLRVNYRATAGPVFVVYLSSVLSMTAIYFILPLIFAIAHRDHERASR